MMGNLNTHKHGSWLNISEIDATNTDDRQVTWQFTTSNARIKLQRVYPVL